MERSDKARELIERAQRMGIRLEMDKRLMLLRVSPSASGEDSRAFITEQILKYLPEIREIVEVRETSIRARELLGRPTLSAERGAGILVDAPDDGGLAISINKGCSTSQTQIMEHAKNLVIVVEEDTGEVRTPLATEPSPSKPARRGIFEMFAGLSPRGREK